jgi:ABC-type antimicrobial peptide transport system permease subunit
LNGCYLYSKLNNKDKFYTTDIKKFLGYYNDRVIKYYISVIALGGFINPVNPDDYRVLYKLTDKGIEVIQSIDQYYNSELYDFCNRYNIDL